MQTRSPSPRNAGFTLVELLAVMAILGLLVSLAVPAVNKLRESGNLRACQSNLRQIALTLQGWVDTDKKGKWHKDRGVKFLLRPAHEGYLEGKGLEIFVCPGTDDSIFIDEDESEIGWKDWDDIDHACCSYAGRDNYGPNALNKNKLDQEIVASDDNEFRGNHPRITNVVYADGTIDQVSVGDYRDELGEDYDFVPVGPESPAEELQKLLIDAPSSGR